MSQLEFNWMNRNKPCKCGKCQKQVAVDESRGWIVQLRRPWCEACIIAEGVQIQSKEKKPKEAGPKPVVPAKDAEVVAEIENQLASLFDEVSLITQAVDTKVAAMQAQIAELKAENEKLKKDNDMLWERVEVVSSDALLALQRIKALNVPVPSLPKTENVVDLFA
ncbi:MAG: hypothetical protein K2W95_00980 [Candidatus Obscuribacterales bacterium]|nr:hypothetical protein [Candidatus Obscuribacterales bacterium]